MLRLIKSAIQIKNRFHQMEKETFQTDSGQQPPNPKPMAQVISCPLCGASPLRIIEGKWGIHCEDLTCANCRVNARNRFYYRGLKNVIEELTGIHSLGLATRAVETTAQGTLRMLEASSFGFVSLGMDGFVRGMSKYGHLTCSDYYEQGFKGISKVDLADMPFEDNSLDIIAHSHVLEHIESDERAISESFRCLSDRGVLVFGIPVQTDFTFKPISPEYHGDNALVYRRNGWDIICKLKNAGFRVEVYVPPEHLAFRQVVPDPSTLVLDNIMLGQKFGANFAKYRELVYPICSTEESVANGFATIWGQLELFVCRKNINRPAGH